MPETNGSIPRFVLDASVIAKWLLPEEDSARAVRLRELAARGDYRLVAPDLWRVELANALWARTHRGPGALAPLDAAAALAVAARLPVLTVPAAPLLASAFELALEGGITVSDALYAALALRDQAPLVTADLRLRDRLVARWPQFGVLALAEV